MFSRALPSRRYSEYSLASHGDERIYLFLRNIPPTSRQTNFQVETVVGARPLGPATTHTENISGSARSSTMLVHVQSLTGFPVYIDFRPVRVYVTTTVSKTKQRRVRETDMPTSTYCERRALPGSWLFLPTLTLHLCFIVIFDW